MKTRNFLYLLIFALNSCQSGSNKNTAIQREITYNQKDKEILEQVFLLFASEKHIPAGDLMIKVGTFFLETPYVGQTLEIEPEQLVVNLRELDCTTFAESVLAISRTLKSENPSFEHFAGELQKIRYRNGTIDGYPSRIHYFSDWIFENNKKNVVKDVSKDLANTPYPLNINFMSTHTKSYKQLKDSLLIPVMAAQEKEISSRTMYFIPTEKIKEIENQLQDGDIAGITTKIEGLDISHVVLLFRKEGKIRVLHASSTAMKVVQSDETLEEYLQNSKMATGIMVARPL